MAIVIMFIGFTGKAFDKDVTVQVTEGESFHLGGYEMKVRDIRSGENDNYAWSHARIDILTDGKVVKTLEPERRAYKASRQPTSEVAIWRRLNEDVYLNFAGIDGEKSVIQAYVFPLVSWIWIGFYFLLMGTLICLIPPKSKEARKAAPVPRAVAPKVERETELAR
jgi:cytochrome c-type biogenesis protein CcmF